MTSKRISTFTVEGPVLDLFVSDCANCGVVFGIPKDLERRRRDDRGRFYCPNGHYLVFGGKTDKQKLDEANARETALKDQLSAAIREGEATRALLVRDRQRFANGVCPCCNRSFENVRRHMSTKHPDYDVTRVATTGAPKPNKCSCGRTFHTARGLAIHQGHERRRAWFGPWDDSETPDRHKHLTVVV